MADLVSASYLAAEAAVKTIKPGVANAEVTDIVKKVADDFGVNLVQGVLMHQMKRYVCAGFASFPKKILYLTVLKQY
jgi:methionine aminopeptidase